MLFVLLLCLASLVVALRAHAPRTLVRRPLSLACPPPSCAIDSRCSFCLPFSPPLSPLTPPPSFSLALVFLPPSPLPPALRTQEASYHQRPQPTRNFKEARLGCASVYEAAKQQLGDQKRLRVASGKWQVASDRTHDKPYGHPPSSELPPQSALRPRDTPNTSPPRRPWSWCHPT